MQELLRFVETVAQAQAHLDRLTDHDPHGRSREVREVREVQLKLEALADFLREQSVAQR